MGSHQATYEAYDQVEVPLMRGAVIIGRCLTIEQATRFLRLQALAGQGSPSAIEQILDEFPKAAGIEGQRLSPVELLQEVLPAFLSHGGTSMNPLGSRTSTSGSTT